MISIQRQLAILFWIHTSNDNNTLLIIIGTQSPLVLLLCTHTSTNIYLIGTVTIISNCVDYVPSPSATVVFE